MAGHSRWAQIKHKKTLTDQKRGQIFSKLVKLITVAAREGTDPDANPKLKAAIEKAKSFNLPNENIERAIKRVGEKDKGQLETLIIEAIGPSNISILIEAITDNKNRTISEIKNILTKNGAKMAHENSLLWQFNQRGVIRIPIPGKEIPERRDHGPRPKQSLTQEEIELQIIEMGADDIVHELNRLIVYTKPAELYRIKTLIQDMGFEIESATLDFIPKTPIKIEDDGVKAKLNKLFEALDGHDDVEEIYSNAII